MRDRFYLVASLALTTLLGCSSVQPAGALRYPALIIGIGESRFPLEAANYRRGDILTYHPGNENISISYIHRDIGLQSLVTLHYYPRGSSFADEVIFAKEEILRAQAGSTLVLEQDISLEKNGVSYPAYMAMFHYSETINSQELTAVSQLILVALPTRFLKVRNAAPIAQGRAAEESMFELLDEVTWVE